MKRSLGPFIALALLVVLGAWVYLREIREGAGKKGEAGLGEESKERPIPFERSSLKAIRIHNEHGALRLEKQGDTWTITEPLKAGADKEAVESLLLSLETARITRRLGPVTDRKAYGLDPPKATLGLESGAAKEGATLEVGDGNPIGGTFFALLPGGKEVAVVGSSIGELAGKDLLALRDKTLLALDPWKVKKVRIERGKEKIVLEKPDDGWKLQEPVEAPADGPAVTDLLGALERLRATAFASEKPAATELRRFGLEPPAARLTLLQEGWDVEKTVIFGKEDGGGRYARTLGRDPVLTVPKDIWKQVQTKVADLRRKDLLGVGQYRIEKVTAAWGEGGRKALVLARQKDQTWSVSGLASGGATADAADLLLRILSDLKARSFEDRPPEALRAALARHPALELTLQEEPDASGKPGKSQHLVISAPDRSGRIRVRDMAWHPIAVADGALLKRITDQLETIAKDAPKAQPTPTPSLPPLGKPGASPSPSH